MYRYNQLIFPSHTEKNTRFFAIAGFALNGPVNAPFILREGADPYEVLGDCRLTENYRLAKSYGINPLIIRLNGSHADALLVHEQLNEPVLTFKTLEATDDCNQILIHLFPDYMIIKGRFTEFSYYFADYTDTAQLAEAIRKDLEFGKGEVEVEVLKRVPITGLCLNESFLSFHGADDGFNFVPLQGETVSDSKLQSQIELLRESFIEEEDTNLFFTGELSSFTVDTLLFTDVPFESAPVDLATIFGGFAASKTEEQDLFCSVVLGSDLFQGTRFVDGVDTYAASVQQLLDIPSLLGEVQNLKHVESVIGTQAGVSPKSQFTPCAPSYALMRYNQSSYYTSGTNKEIPSIGALLSQELTQDEVAKLSGSGYIVIVHSIKRGFVAFSSKNLHPQSSVFARPHYLRSLHDDVRKITGYFSRYIGEPMSIILLQTILNQIYTFIGTTLLDHPLYKNLSIELLDYTPSKVSLSLVFEFYGEVETVRTSFEYSPINEVNVTWQ